jgi:hypothetical protein
MASARKLAEADSTDLVRPNTFLQRFPDVATAGGLRWQIHNSATNGLDHAHAVIRKHARPNSKRPIVFIDVPKYFRWLRGDAEKAA